MSNNFLMNVLCEWLTYNYLKQWNVGGTLGVLKRSVMQIKRNDS